jgi:hypothetical protein
VTFSTLEAALGSSTSTQQQIFNAWNSTIEIVLDSDTFTVTQDTWNQIQQNLALLSPTSNSTNDTKSTAENTILAYLFGTILDGYDFEPPETDSTSPMTFDDFYHSYDEVFTLIFEYFFICAGLVLISLAILASFSLLKGESRKSRLYIGIISNFILGTGLTLLSTMVLTAAADNLGYSVWTLPLPTFVLLIALVLNHVPRWLAGM